MITANMSPSQIATQTPIMGALSKWFLTGASSQYVEDIPLSVNGETGEYIVKSLIKLENDIAQGKQCLYDLYSKEEVDQSPDKALTQLLFFRGDPEKPSVVICPGGAYMSVCALVEGMGTAYALNELGYNAFVLVYRVDHLGPEPLLPKPMDDLARAVEMLTKTDTFAVRQRRYAVLGFSAGGHLAASWGTANHGYRSYGLNGPEALLLAYPALSTDCFMDNIEQSGPAPDESAAVGMMFLAKLGGDGYTRESLSEYSIEKHVDDAYPPTYIVHCKDDEAVDYHGSELFVKALEQENIRHIFNTLECGGHGFSTGLHMEASGWLEHAVLFWRNVAEPI